jgi:type VI secretion system protein ImpC
MTGNERYRVVLDVAAGAEGARQREERPFRILVLGDFSGVQGADAGRTGVVEVDRDNIDDVMAALRPAVRFQLGGAAGPEVAIEFESIEDFHPDRLLQRVPLLRSLVELREQARQGRLPSVESKSGEAARPAARSSAPLAGGGLLDHIVAETAAAAPPAAAEPADDLQAFIRSAVAPGLVPAVDPSQVALAAEIDDTLAVVLRSILHQPDFQALESAWLGVSLLVRRLETGAQLKVFLLDLSRDRLAAELSTDADLQGSALHRALAAARSDGAPYSLLAGLFTFGGSAADTALLEVVGGYARAAGAPFVAAAAPSLAGLGSFANAPDVEDLHAVHEPAWDALRRSPGAPFIGLAAPRFLLRAPYDPRQEPCEDIVFTEVSEPPAHDDFLWGHPALAVALLIGDAFAEGGGPMSLELGGLPLHFYGQDGAVVAQPCAETLLNDRVAMRIMESGVMPLLSQKNGDAVRLVALRSIAAPAAELAGCWASGVRAAQ